MIDSGPMPLPPSPSSEGRPSYKWENREYLLNVIMNQLGLNDSDLENDPSWIRAKVRDANIDKVLEK